MDVSIAPFLLVNGPGLHGGVIGAGELAGKRDDIVVPAGQELVQIHGGRGTRRLGRVRPGPHFLQEFPLVKVLAVHHGFCADLNGERNFFHAGIRLQLGGQVGAAITDQSICHFKNRLK